MHRIRRVFDGLNDKQPGRVEDGLWERINIVRDEEDTGVQVMGIEREGIRMKGIHCRSS